VIEYQRHRLACPRCGDSTCAVLPPGVPARQSGPRLVAFAGLVMAYFRQSERGTALFLEALLNQPFCPALTLKMQAQLTQALRPAYEELARALAEQRRLGIGEPPTKVAGEKSWLWTFVADLFSVFAARSTRAATVLSELQTDAFSSHPRLVGMCRKSYDHRAWMWAFLEQEAEPTNNASERALRHAVIWRKRSFGTQNAGGRRPVRTRP
jgi:hypothetical protein